jgi:phosphoribosylamine--glycine ligase
MHERIMREVIIPTVEGMSADGIPYTGFLYAGVMIDKDGVPKVLEFNCRFGDPETQPIMMRLQSDLVDLVQAAIEKRLDQVTAQWDARAALGIVLAAGNYPEGSSKGEVISGLERAAQLPGKVFHAGAALKDSQVLTNGGRVLCAVGLGDTVTEAQRQAYDLAAVIHWNQVYFRTDIGHRAIAREIKR